MQARACSMVLAVCVSWTTAVAAAVSQDGHRLVLAPKQSEQLLDTGLSVTFETVEEDSRCPVNMTCVWAGDAIVRIRVDARNTKPSLYTLHTSERSTREISHAGVLLRLISLAPLPTPDGPPRSDDYRLTLSVQRRN